MQDRRRYRFRAWHRSDRRLYPVISIPRGGTVIKDDEMVRTCDREDVELMQYSGLTDSNQREIYESDVVECEAEDFSGIAVVIFENGAFSLKPVDSSRESVSLNLQTIQDCQLKVVGSIYESSRIGGGA
jgi:uncharacterized phage protein (TIGR01671 family)